MAKLERVHEKLTSPLTQEYVDQRASQGWRLVGVDWERQAEGAGSGSSTFIEEVPYGLKVSTDCQHLEENPEEKQVLISMLEWIVQDFPLSQVAGKLNQQGLRMRSGAKWDPISVFQLLPRLIEVGPRIFSTEDWAERRKHLFKLVS